jgi:aryl-alcohol dehydrogenase-like predicted oxidoreductase
MERRRLGNTGLEVAQIAYGTASLGQEYGRIELTDALRVVPAVIDAGIDLIDTAPYYGRGMSEVLLGLALRGIPRERYKLCSKLGRYGVGWFDFSRQRVFESIDTSLHRLGVERLDIALCHDVEFGDLEQVVGETIPALRECQAAGKVGAVGVSGYPLAAFRRILARTELDVVLSYANLTLQNRCLEGLVPSLRERGTGLLNAAPFDMRLLTGSGPPAWHPAPAEVRAACLRAAEHCRARGHDLAKLAFQFSVTADGPAATVVGTAYESEVRQWLAWLDEPIDASLLAEIDAILAPVRDRGRAVGRVENNS